MSIQYYNSRDYALYELSETEIETVSGGCGPLCAIAIALAVPVVVSAAGGFIDGLGGPDFDGDETPPSNSPEN